MTRLRRRSAVTQIYWCPRSKARRTRQVGQFVRERLRLDGKALRRTGAARVSEAEMLFARRMA